jgi:hypothetical protein
MGTVAAALARGEAVQPIQPPFWLAAEAGDKQTL